MFWGTLETGVGLDVILWFGENRVAPLDVIALVLNYAGGVLAYLLLVPLLYWLVDRDFGLRVAFAVIAGGAANIALKLLFARPRPFEVSEAVMPLVEAEGFGIPSGHVMVSLVVFGYIAHTLHDRRALVVWALYIAAQMWARMYLGVHYPQDVIVGVLAGLPVLWAYIRLEWPVAQMWARFDLLPRVATTVLAAIVSTVMLFGDEAGMVLAGLLTGALVGLLTMQQRGATFEAQGLQLAPQPRIQLRQVWLAVLGLLLAIGLLFGLDTLLTPLAAEGSGAAALLRVLRYAVVAWFIVAVWPLVALRRHAGA